MENPEKNLPGGENLSLEEEIRKMEADLADNFPDTAVIPRVDAPFTKAVSSPESSLKEDLPPIKTSEKEPAPLKPLEKEIIPKEPVKAEISPVKTSEKDSVPSTLPEQEVVAPAKPLEHAVTTASSQDTAEDQEEPKKKPKKKKKGGRVVTVLVIAVLLALLVSALCDLLGTGGNANPIAFQVEDGAGTSIIARQLKNQGVIRHPMVFKLYAKTKGELIYQRGIHFISDSMSYDQLMASLTAAADSDQNMRRIVIPEGYELRQVVDLLVENGLGNKETFYHEIENGSFDFDFVDEIPRTENRLEGYLYPDTYLFTTEESEHEILAKMLENFSDKVIPVYESYDTDKSLDDILIFASVIEREAANDEERPLVASVFENRLEEGMKLESCATVQYILKERKEILSKADIAIDSPYNTYLYEGLPAGPIASPGLPSMEAALEPADTDYLYFLATADGSENLFSETFEEHNRKLEETQG